ncbi:hypothetical protein ES703_02149 [subsurface metagenome]
MFREVMKVSVSKAEYRVIFRLEKLGYGQHMVMQRGHTFLEYRDGVRGTWTDIEYLTPYELCIFIDLDKWHQKSKQQLRDERVSTALRVRGYTVKRYLYSYDSRKGISDTKLTEVTTDIIAVLKSKGYKPTK